LGARLPGTSLRPAGCTTGLSSSPRLAATSLAATSLATAALASSTLAAALSLYEGHRLEQGTCWGQEIGNRKQALSERAKPPSASGLAKGRASGCLRNHQGSLIDTAKRVQATSINAVKGNVRFLGSLNCIPQFDLSVPGQRKIL